MNIREKYGGYDFILITDNSYVIKDGDRFLRPENKDKKFSTHSEEFEGYEGIVVCYFNNFVVYEKILKPWDLTYTEKRNVEIPERFRKLDWAEIIEDDDYYMHWSNRWIPCKGRFIKNALVGKYEIIRYIRSPEELIRIKKEKSSNFVKTNLKNPSPADFEKFEKVFLREDNFGL